MQMLSILAFLQFLIVAGWGLSKPETKPALSGNIWPSYLTQKVKLQRCLLLSARIHYLSKSKALPKRSEVGQPKLASNEATILLATSVNKYKSEGCVLVQRGLQAMRVAVSVFSELLELPPRAQEQQEESETSTEEEAQTVPETADDEKDAQPAPAEDSGSDIKGEEEQEGRGKNFITLENKPAGDKKPVADLLKPADDKKPVADLLKPADDKKPVADLLKPADDKKPGNLKPADDKKTEAEKKK